MIQLYEEKQKMPQVQDLWESPLVLCGLNFNDGIPFSKKEIYPVSSFFKSQDSPVFQFMCLLDCKIQKLKNEGKLGSKDAEEILGFNWQTLSSKLKILNSEQKIFDFHEWFCALDDCLFKLNSKSFEKNE